MFRKTHWVGRIKPTEMKKREWAAVDEEAIVLPAESSGVDIPVRDVIGIVFENRRPEQARNKVDPFLIRHQTLWDVNEAAISQPRLPPR
jgi:hypothetical protein